tara:strand:- start:12 stop:212 length:201 start_codon:yes stop_codon:yes gene_type:complete
MLSTVYSVNRLCSNTKQSQPREQGLFLAGLVAGWSGGWLVRWLVCAGLVAGLRWLVTLISWIRLLD